MKIKPLDIVCPFCSSKGWCMKTNARGERVRAPITHRVRVKLAQKLSKEQS